MPTINLCFCLRTPLSSRYALAHPGPYASPTAPRGPRLASLLRLVYNQTVLRRIIGVELFAMKRIHNLARLTSYRREMFGRRLNIAHFQNDVQSRTGVMLEFRAVCLARFKQGET